MCVHRTFSLPLFPHTRWHVGVKLVHLVVGGLEVGSPLATLLPVLWDSEHKVEASWCQWQTGAAM